MNIEKTQFTFKVTDEFKKIVEHTINNPEQSPIYGEKVTEPSILFVKDDGVYLMSNSMIRLPRNEEEKKKMDAGEQFFGAKVAYAVGHDPSKDEDWWVGGDDFGQDLPVKYFHDSIQKGANRFQFKLNSNSFSFKAMYPKIKQEIKNVGQSTSDN